MSMDGYKISVTIEPGPGSIPGRISSENFKLDVFNIVRKIQDELEITFPKHGKFQTNVQVYREYRKEIEVPLTISGLRMIDLNLPTRVQNVIFADRTIKDMPVSEFVQRYTGSYWLRKGNFGKASYAHLQSAIYGAGFILKDGQSGNYDLKHLQTYQRAKMNGRGTL